MQTRLITILTILAFIFTFYFDKFFVKLLFAETKNTEITQVVKDATSSEDEFFDILFSSNKFLYCANDTENDVSYFHHRCERLLLLPSAKKYKFIKENKSDVENSKCRNNTNNCLAKIIRTNCIGLNAFCIIDPKKNKILRFDFAEKDFMEKVLFDYE